MNTRSSQGRVTGFLVVAGIFLSTNLLGATTVWWVRGEAWGNLGKGDKSLYVQGVLDGLVFAGGKIEDVVISYKTSTRDLVAALDTFYEDQKNELIPVPFALKITSMEISGVEKLKVDAELEKMRKYFYEQVKEALRADSAGRGKGN